jgi:hypothetical protein
VFFDFQEHICRVLIARGFTCAEEDSGHKVVFCNC